MNKQIKYFILASLLHIISINSFAQKNETVLLKPGLYFFSQSVSEWVGGGYYILKPDSSFICFSTLWNEVVGCGAIDVNSNYYGVGVWRVFNNRLQLNFKKPKYSELRFNSSIIYSAKNQGNEDSVFIHIRTTSVIKNWFVEIITTDENKNRRIIKPVVNKPDIIIPISALEKPKSINISSVGYYSQEVELLAGFNFHYVDISTLQKRGNECFQYIEPQNINWKIIKKSDIKFLYGNLLQITDVANQKDDILLKLKKTEGSNPLFNLIVKRLIGEIQQITIRK